MTDFTNKIVAKPCRMHVALAISMVELHHHAMTAYGVHACMRAWPWMDPCNSAAWIGFDATGVAIPGTQDLGMGTRVRTGVRSI